MHSPNRFKSKPLFKYSLSILLGFLLIQGFAYSANAGVQLTCPDSLPPYFSPAASDLSEPCGGGNDQVNLTNWLLNKGGAIPLDSCNTASWVDFDFLTSEGLLAVNTSFDSLLQFPMVPSGNCNWSVQASFRATDTLGNESITTATFRLVDTESPMLIGVPSNAIANCDAIPPAAFTLCRHNRS